MAEVDGGDLVVRMLKGEGVQYLFSLSGGHISPIYDACLDEGIRVIDTRHEQAAAHMADGWARVTGGLGVAAVTAGPGVTDAITGLANAYEAGSPMLLIGGKSETREFGTGAMQDMDQLALVRPITKWAQTVYETRRIPEYLAEAFRHALSGRPGPVYLEIPRDVLYASVDEAQVPWPQSYRTRARVEGDSAMVRQAVDLLLAAQKPVIISGGGVRWSEAAGELQELAELAQLPVVLVALGRGCVPEDHPMCFGPTRVSAAGADVILVVGARLNWELGFGRPPLFAQGAKLIQVDIDAQEIGRNRGVDVGIVGDARAVLRQMIRGVQARGRKPERAAWLAECRAYAQSRRQRLQEAYASSTVPIHAGRLCQEVADFLERDAIVALDGGDITIWAAGILRVNHPGHWLDQGAFGCLGPGIPFAIAAKLAKPDKQVLVINGDGSFGLNAMEFDTAIRHRVPIVSVIGNDAAWGMVKHGQERDFGPDRVVGTELRFTRYDKMVEALGGYGELVERPEDIRPALKRAFASGLPACINVRVDPTVVTQAGRPGRR